MMSTPDQEHIDVAPRMWDKSIAASFVKKNSNAEHKLERKSKKKDESVSAESAIVDATILNRLKPYIMPALLILVIIVATYVLWKYFTKYRNTKSNANANIPVIKASDLLKAEKKRKIINPADLVASEDLTKYEYDSETDNIETKESQKHVSFQNMPIDEEESEDDEPENESSAGEYDEDDDSDTADSPDLAEIEQMIQDNGLEDINPVIPDDVIMVEPPTEDATDETKAVSPSKSKQSPSRKNRRVKI